jgi:hypothetical protein
MRKWTLDGGRFVNKLGLITTWMRERSNNFGRFWSGTKMFLLGTRVSWVAALLENILWIHKDYHLARHLLVDYPTAKRLK